MPDPKLQRYVGTAAFVGVLTSCFGCALMVQNQVTASAIVLVVAELILVPAFVILLRTRRKLKRVYQQQERRREAELEALGNLTAITTQKETNSDQ